MSQRHLRRFFSSSRLPEENHSFSLSSEESYHLAKVVCLQMGEACLVLDSYGNEVEAMITSISDHEGVSLTVVKSLDSKHPPQTLKLIVFQAIPKKAKFDWLIQKAQELGVFQVFPLMSERTIVRIDSSKEKAKLERWHKLAIEAAKQSGARDIVRVEAPVDFEGAKKALSEIENVLLFHPSTEAVDVGDWCKDSWPAQDKDKNVSKKIAVFVGPEGGFSDREIQSIKLFCEKNEKDFQMLHLGSQILKSDTAFVAIVSILKYLT